VVVLLLWLPDVVAQLLGMARADALAGGYRPPAPPFPGSAQYQQYPQNQPYQQYPQSPPYQQNPGYRQNPQHPQGGQAGPPSGPYPPASH
jgi:hypothetical protein